MLTTEDITNFLPPSTTLVLISVLKARRKVGNKNISPIVVLNIYTDMCKANLNQRTRQVILNTLSQLDLAGFIKTCQTKTGIVITEVGFGENTPEVMENLIYQDPRFTQYKDYVPAI